MIDETFRDVWFPGHPPLPPRMAAFDTGHRVDRGLRVLSLGSMSKSIWGGLRIGWIRAAPALIHRLATARALCDMSGPVLEQLIAAHFLADAERAFDPAAPPIGRRRCSADPGVGRAVAALVGQPADRRRKPVG